MNCLVLKETHSNTHSMVFGIQFGQILTRNFHLYKGLLWARQSNSLEIESLLKLWLVEVSTSTMLLAISHGSLRQSILTCLKNQHETVA